MRSTKATHARGKLQAKRPGDGVAQTRANAPGLFAERAKSPEADNVGRKMRPRAHAPVQAAKAKKHERVVKRLSNKVI
jgi:hypothetical protein